MPKPTQRGLSALLCSLTIGSKTTGIGTMDSSQNPTDRWTARGPLILALAVQLVIGIGWITSLNYRIETIEHTSSDHTRLDDKTYERIDDLLNRLTRVEERQNVNIRAIEQIRELVQQHVVQQSNKRPGEDPGQFVIPHADRNAQP
jgi:hypothetical protein